jgi:integrase
MASIWKHPNSSFWTACYTDETGKQRKRSTKQKDVKSAKKVAEGYEEACRKSRVHELTRATATHMINDLMERTHGEGLDLSSTSEYLTSYLAGLQTKTATLKRYRPIFDGFLAHLGEDRAKARLASVTSQEVESFRAAELESGKTPATANFAIKVLNGAFEKARRDAVILHNPVQRINRLRNANTEERMPFTDAHVSKLLEVADLQWQGMILFAFHTGIRLSDAANLTWANLDGKVLRFREQKTSHRKQRASERETRVVMARDLLEYIAALPSPVELTTPLFPSLHGKKSGSAGGLSNAFSRIMIKAGINCEPGEKKTGKGRQFSSLSFHSLRHTMISRLANSDAPEAVTKAMSGHSTEEAHRRYVHLDEDAQDRVISKAPRVWTKQ